jgi:amidohydrolase
MSDWLKQEVESTTARVIEWRRMFHQHPELGMEEHWTAEKIAEILKSFDLPVQTGIGQTGVVAVLEGEKPGPTLMLRADMDALPIQEENDLEYASRIPDRMHACGHDGHMAILLGLADILSRNRDKIPGRVKFVFQPGEEGFGGAKFMMDDGVLKDPPVNAAFGLHLISYLPVGMVGVKTGPMMACADWFHVKVNGVGGHAAMPEAGGVDAILIAAQSICALQNLATKEIPPLEPFVLHVGTIEGGQKFNVIADKVEFTGTVRTLNEELRQTVKTRMDRILSGVASSLGGSHELTYADGYPPVMNDPAMTDLVREAARAVVSVDKVIEVPPTMGADDMAYFLQEVPGCYFFVGISNADKGITWSHHHGRFDMDEDALAIGMEIMLRTAMAYLEQ